LGIFGWVRRFNEKIRFLGKVSTFLYPLSIGTMFSKDSHIGRLTVLDVPKCVKQLLTTTRSELKQGLLDMNAFELGYTMSFASLQSVVWRIFCKKANCSLQDSWAPAKALIEAELIKYKIG
jgi:hypothetical protein